MFFVPLVEPSCSVRPACLVPILYIGVVTAVVLRGEGRAVEGDMGVIIFPRWDKKKQSHARQEYYVLFYRI